MGELGMRRVGSLLPGAIFGQRSLIDGLPRLATCRAVGDVRVAELDRDLFLQLCQEGSRFATNFQMEVARALIRQLRQSNQALSEMSSLSSHQEESTALTDWLDAIMTDSRRAW